MGHAVQWVRSLVFQGQMYFMMLVIGLVFAPWAFFSRDGARSACKTYCRWVRWTASWMIGLRTEVRGTPPTGQVLVAAKHQSFLDIMLIFQALPTAYFIMKRSILWTPIIGLYAKKLGCVPVDRGKRGAAIQKMLRDVENGDAQAGQLIIYPQGTRIAPGVSAPYKVGTGALYEQLSQTCVPVAANVGVFWPRIGILRKPGLAVVEFLPAISTGMSSREFMETLEATVETASNKLMEEAGFQIED